MPDAGATNGGVHVYPLRVYFEDTDAGGVVYYANYLRFAERARTEMLRAAGFDHRGLADDGLIFLVRWCEADYRAPARLDDALEVHTANIEFTGTSILGEQTVMRGAETLMTLKIRLVCAGTDGRPKRLPEMLRTALSPLMKSLTD